MTLPSTRRRLLGLLAGSPLLLAVPGLQAQTAEEDNTPIVKADDIVRALDKDIVLDQPGADGNRRPTSQPAVHLRVPFTFDSAELRPQGKRQLDELALALGHQALARWGFLLAGHTDRVGSAAYNNRLSLARAEAVKAYLAEAHRLPADRLQTIGYGHARPIDARHPEAAVNRRVEVRRIPLAQMQAPASPAPRSRLVPTPN